MKEQDLFFHYTYSCAYTDFQLLQKDQKLTIGFEDYPNLLIKVIKDCIASPMEYFYIIIISQYFCFYFI